MVQKTANDLKNNNPELFQELVNRCKGKVNKKLNNAFQDYRITKQDGTVFKTVQQIILNMN
jgi:hypothetical protein